MESHLYSREENRAALEKLTRMPLISWWELRHIQEPLGVTEDRSLIRETILGTDKAAKRYLLENPSLTTEEMLLLAKDSSTEIREHLACRSNLAEEALELLRQDSSATVRLNALSNPLTPLPVFVEGVVGKKFPLEVKRELVWNMRVVESAKVFEFLWALKSLRPMLVATLDNSIKQSAPVDSKVFSLVHDEARSSGASLIFKQWYASADYVARPEVLDFLKDDPSRGLASRIAHNRSAWVSTHEYLVEHYGKGLDVRCSVATVTGDNYLLNKIYHGTRSKVIRDCVSSNPAFDIIPGFES